MTTIDEADAAAGTASPAEPAGAFRKGPLLVLLAGTFMTFLDFFIVLWENS